MAFVEPIFNCNCICRSLQNNIKMLLLYLLMFLAISQTTTKNAHFPDGFDYLRNIDHTILQSPRYATPYNFVGEIIDGYKTPEIVITVKAGRALSRVQSDLRQLGYTLVVYDAYRPQKAVDHFMRWVAVPQDNKTKAEWYPYLNKNTDLVPGYIASKSGHTRGSTVDLTIMQLNKKIHDVKLFNTTLNNGQSIIYRDDGTEFMCSPFDHFGLCSNHDTPLVSQECTHKRNLLRSFMLANGFRALSTEWWHYTLNDEPFPQTYFDFDIV